MSLFVHREEEVVVRHSIKTRHSENSTTGRLMAPSYFDPPPKKAY